MRKNQTSAESKLWEALRRKNLGGLKFKRQVVIGPYIADFYCHAFKLIIEADGEIHTLPEQMSHDMKRQAWLESEGYVMLRFSNDSSLNNLDHVLQTVLKHSTFPLLEGKSASCSPAGGMDGIRL